MNARCAGSAAAWDALVDGEVGGSEMRRGSLTALAATTALTTAAGASAQVPDAAVAIDP